MGFLLASAQGVQEPTDPFVYPLSPHLLRILVFQHLNFDEIRAFTCVSPHWNEVVADSMDYTSKLKLHVKFFQHLEDFETENVLKTVRANKRKYKFVKLRSVKAGEVKNELKLDLFAIMENLGECLKVLEVSCKNLFYEDLKKLLSTLENLEEFKCNERIEGDPYFLTPINFPKLKRLSICGSSRSSVLMLFLSVTTLEVLNFRPMEIDLITRPIGDFIMRQDNLKHLNISFKFYERETNEPLFPKDRLQEIKFQLETINAFSRDIEFFDTQNELKEIFIDMCYKVIIFPQSPEKYAQFLRNVLSKPFLQAVYFDFGSIRESHLDFLNDIRNLSVTNVHYNETCGSTLEAINLMFPRLEQLSVNEVSKTALKTMQLNHLMKLRISDEITDFHYTLSASDVPGNIYEETLLSFIRIHRKIEKFSLGRTSWLFNENFSVSTTFWKYVLEFLPNLQKLTVYNPRDSEELIKMLLNSACKFKEVRIFMKPTTNLSEKILRITRSSSWLRFGRFGPEE
jgi:hypothetical protein